MPSSLALFTPLPPVRSGVAAYAAELVPRLAEATAIDLFVDPGVPWRPGPTDADRAACAAQLTWKPGARTSHPVTVLPAHEFVRRHRLAPYELVVYQMGNAIWHDYVWPYLVRHPGLTVLHDAQLHHARARLLLSQDRRDDYRVEFRYNHPDADPRVAEYVVAGLQGAPYYVWPMLGVAVAASRGVAVHGARLADMLRTTCADVPVWPLRMGVRSHAPAPGPDAAARRDDGTVLFAAYGLVTPEKRVPEILRAFRAVARRRAGVRLLLVGGVVAHYDVRREVAELGIGDRVTITGYVPDEDLDGWLSAADVCLCLRWPTSRETSASWLRCLAAGKPTIVIDLAHTVDVPTLDPRDWQIRHARNDASAALEPPRAAEAVAVSIDVLDEEHSLTLALDRLAEDGPLRGRLGGRARAWWGAHHTLDCMARDYLDVIEAVRATPPSPAPKAPLPAHLRADGTELAARLAAEVGVTGPIFE